MDNWFFIHILKAKHAWQNYYVAIKIWHDSDHISIINKKKQKIFLINKLNKRLSLYLLVAVFFLNSKK